MEVKILFHQKALMKMEEAADGKTAEQLIKDALELYCTLKKTGFVDEKGYIILEKSKWHGLRRERYRLKMK